MLLRSLRWFGTLFVALSAFSIPQASAQTETYLVTVVDAQIAPLKQSKRRWDGGFGKMTLPDVFVQFEIAGKRFRTTVLYNTLHPSWKITWTIQARPEERMYIKVLDKDLADNDLIGEGDVLLGNMPPKLFFGQVLSLRITVEKVSKPVVAPIKPIAPVKPIVVEPIKPIAPVKPIVVEPIKPIAPVKPIVVEPIKPIAPVKPVVAPVKPVVAPVKPVVAPVKPVVAPVKPVVAPVKPVVAPVKPVVAPVKPVVAPVKPVVAPVKPVVAPATLPKLPTSQPVSRPR